MARYIDADKLIEALQTDYDREGAKADDMAMYGDADLSVKYSHGQFCYLNAIERVKDTSTSDVVPKSEVVKVLDEIEKTIRGALVLVGFSYKHNPKEIQGKEECYEDFLGYIAELKKKYTEGKE